MRIVCLIAVCALALTGCKSAPPEKPATPPPSKTSTPAIQQPEAALRWAPPREEPVDLLGRPKPLSPSPAVEPRAPDAGTRTTAKGSYFAPPAGVRSGPASPSKAAPPSATKPTASKTPKKSPGGALAAAPKSPSPPAAKAKSVTKAKPAAVKAKGAKTNSKKLKKPTET